jgi:ABC-type nitrate/sulfonate/bicarbonate transport system substrate-binding protein
MFTKFQTENEEKHMQKRLLNILIGAMLIVVLGSVSAGAVHYIDAPPLIQVIKEQVGDVSSSGGKVTVPLITWGGDIATIYANGNNSQTSVNSIFGQKGLQINLVRQDDFKKQLAAYIRGETPYLRGTMGMISLASELLSKNPRTKPVIIYQHTWSNGGDCLVVKKGINRTADLKGKTVALQAYGPHVDYLSTLLKNSGLKMSDVNIKWVKDLTGTAETPAEAFYDSSVDAAMMIIPDGLMLTSNGTVGTGAEGSVKGAKIMLSTKSANRVIADVYAVRTDYFEQNRQQVQELVHGLLLAEQDIKQLFKNRQKQMAKYQETIRASAKILLDSEAATGDAEALYGDCEYVGFKGNVKFFEDQNWPRNFMRISDEIQSAYVIGNLLGRQTQLEQAKWDYSQLSPGITGIDAADTQRFNVEEVAKVVAEKQAMGTLGEGELFSFQVFFKPNQNTFTAASYEEAFTKVVELASTYGGAVITIEGHSDPLGYLRKKKENANEIVLRRVKQAAKNLSLTRAIAVRDSIMSFASGSGINLDRSQFTVVGHGISQPSSGMCGADPCPPKTKEEWLKNMRVVFRIIQIEAEESAFRPLD